MKKYICILLPFMLLSCSKEAYNFKEQLPRTHNLPTRICWKKYGYF